MVSNIILKYKHRDDHFDFKQASYFGRFSETII